MVSKVMMRFFKGSSAWSEGKLILELVLSTEEANMTMSLAEAVDCAKVVKNPLPEQAFVR